MIADTSMPRLARPPSSLDSAECWAQLTNGVEEVVPDDDLKAYDQCVGGMTAWF